MTWNLTRDCCWESFYIFSYFWTRSVLRTRGWGFCCWELAWTVHWATFLFYLLLVPLAFNQPHQNVLSLPSFNYSQFDFVLPGRLPLSIYFHICEMMESQHFRIWRRPDIQPSTWSSIHSSLIYPWTPKFFSMFPGKPFLIPLADVIFTSIGIYNASFVLFFRSLVYNKYTTF